MGPSAGEVNFWAGSGGCTLYLDPRGFPLRVTCFLPPGILDHSVKESRTCPNSVRFVPRFADVVNPASGSLGDGGALDDGSVTGDTTTVELGDDRESASLFDRSRVVEVMLTGFQRLFRVPVVLLSGEGSGQEVARSSVAAHALRIPASISSSRRSGLAARRDGRGG